MSQLIYLGPYLECQIHKKSIESSYLACETSSCPDYGISSSLPFCSRCGQPRSERTRIEKVPIVDSGVVHESIREALVNIRVGDMEIWLPNVKRGKHRRFQIHEEDQAICAFASDGSSFIETELRWFSESYAAELAVIHNAYQDAKVLSCWGLVAYWR